MIIIIPFLVPIVILLVVCAFITFIRVWQIHARALLAIHWFLMGTGPPTFPSHPSTTYDAGLEEETRGDRIRMIFLQENSKANRFSHLTSMEQSGSPLPSNLLALEFCLENLTKHCFIKAQFTVHRYWLPKCLDGFTHWDYASPQKSLRVMIWCNYSINGFFYC